jgi:hypothetical protein
LRISTLLVDIHIYLIFYSLKAGFAFCCLLKHRSDHRTYYILINSDKSKRSIRGLHRPTYMRQLMKVKKKLNRSRLQVSNSNFIKALTFDIASCICVKSILFVLKAYII